MPDIHIDFANILNQMNQHIFVRNRDGRYLYANKHYVSLAGFDTLSEIVGKRDSELHWATSAQNIQESDIAVLEGTSIINDVQTYRDSNTQILLSKKPYMDHDGNIIGVICNFVFLDTQLVLEQGGSFCEEEGRLHLEYVPESLTAPEVKVCFYLIHGFPASKISKKIGKSVGTVNYHITNIKEKMMCESKHEITEKLMTTGIAWKIFALQHDLH